MLKKRYFIFFGIILSVVFLDQLSKWLIEKYLMFGESVKLLPWLNFYLQYNRGAAFSLLDSEGGWQIGFLAFLAVVVCFGLIFWLLRSTNYHRIQAFAVSLIVGGALGNLIDRVRFKYVIDFIDFHLGDWHYFTFNLADSAITIGVFLLIFFLLTRHSASK